MSDQPPPRTLEDMLSEANAARLTFRANLIKKLLHGLSVGDGAMVLGVIYGRLLAGLDTDEEREGLDYLFNMAKTESRDHEDT